MQKEGLCERKRKREREEGEIKIRRGVERIELKSRWGH